MRRSARLTMALAAVTGLAGVLVAATVATAASPTTTPPFEPDPNAYGTVTLYNAAGTVITSGKLSDDPVSAYAAGSVAAPPAADGGLAPSSYTKATLLIAAPQPGENSLDWPSVQMSASTTYPNTSAPADIANAKDSKGNALPVESGASTNYSLSTAIANFAAQPSSSPDFDIYQLRVYQSGPGVAPGNNFEDVDILINPSAGTWTQIYPTPVATTPTYTWVGTGSKNSADHSWSDAVNWQGGKAPAANSTVNLVFPVLTCTAGAKCGNVSTNNIAGLTVKSLTVDLSGAATQPQPGTYDITGTAIKIGGLTVSTPTTLAKGKLGQSAQLLTPMTLTGNETWAVTLGPSAKFSVAGVTGTGTLGIGLKPVTIGGGQLAFTAAVNTGAVTITGPSSGSVTSTALPAVAINSNGKAVTLTDTALTAANSGTTTLGPLTVTKSALTIGAKGGAGPYGILKTDGKAALTSTSTLSFQGLEKPSGAPVAGTNYPQLSATGPITLASAKLALFAGCTNPVGTTYTIIKTTGKITGTFAGLANGAKVQATKDTQASCTKSGATAPFFTITYTATTVTAKVVAAPALPARLREAFAG